VLVDCVEVCVILFDSECFVYVVVEFDVWYWLVVLSEVKTKVVE